MAQLTGFSSQLKFKLTDDQKKWLISLKSGPKKATGVGFNGGYLKDMRLSGIIEITKGGKVMTWGHCGSCHWRWVPWAGPCIHVPPKEGEECIGFSPAKEHRRPKGSRGGA